ncbi:MAG: ABC transporter permease, partial [Acidobacteria bacterium]|nr:ABC transporter permease [Acidobacteriota bacterium]
PDEFAAAWKASTHRASLAEEVEDYLQSHPFDGDSHEKFLESRRADQSASQRAKSPFTLSFLQQTTLTLWRSWTLLKADPSAPLAMLTSNTIESLVVSSVFYNLPVDTSTFLRRGILMFYIILVNLFASILEIFTLYAKRRTVEKHARYAFYHPSAEALASMVVDVPYKVVNAVVINTIAYFIGNLRREPGPYFFFLLISFTITVVASMLFRLIASVSRSIDQALSPAAILIIGMILYTGFAIPPPYMEAWIAWFRWLNPVYYGLEALILNDMAGRDFACASFVPRGPGYEDVAPGEKVCATEGSVAGLDYVRGSDYVATAYGFYESDRWRNFGILIALGAFLLVLHLLATEYITSDASKGEVLVFTRGAMEKQAKAGVLDVETSQVKGPQHHRTNGNTSEEVTDMEKQESIFHWKDVCYDIQIKKENRQILDRVDGWVKPGTLTALMVSP